MALAPLSLPGKQMGKSIAASVAALCPLAPQFPTPGTAQGQGQALHEDQFCSLCLPLCITNKQQPKAQS